MLSRILILACVLKTIYGANILLVSSLPSKSHHIWNEALAIGLIENGHNVTMLSHHVIKKNVTNFTVIVLEENKLADYDLEEFAKLNSMQLVKSMYDMLHDQCIDDVRSNGFKQLLNYPNEFKFDLILWDIYVGQCMYPLIDRFGNPPLIGTSAFGLQHNLAQTFGNQIPFYPYYSSEITYNRMTYIQRFAHHFNVNFLVWYYKLMYLPAQYQVAKKIFVNMHVKDLEMYERDFKLLLTNTDPLMDYAIPLTPNIIPVAGLHIMKPKKLPNDIQKLLDDTKDGIVYFALGSNIKPQLLKKFKNILKVIEMIPYKVLWKIDADNLNVKFPKNVITMKWCPQNDILAHKNVKMFISHGGALSTQEAIYHGVPLLIIPLFLDQITNAIRIIDRNLGLRVPYCDLTTENLYESAIEVLNNPMYKKNMKKMSEMFKDQLNGPLERAVHWTEYVLKHRDMKYMDVINRDMYFYETIHLDLLIIILVLLLTCLIVILATIYCCFKLTSKHSKKIKKS